MEVIRISEIILKFTVPIEVQKPKARFGSASHFGPSAPTRFENSCSLEGGSLPAEVRSPSSQTMIPPGFNKSRISLSAASGSSKWMSKKPAVDEVKRFSGQSSIGCTRRNEAYVINLRR